MYICIFCHLCFSLKIAYAWNKFVRTLKIKIDLKSWCILLPWSSTLLWMTLKIMFKQYISWESTRILQLPVGSILAKTTPYLSIFAPPCLVCVYMYFFVVYCIIMCYSRQHVIQYALRLHNRKSQRGNIRYEITIELWEISEIVS